MKTIKSNHGLYTGKAPGQGFGVPLDFFLQETATLNFLLGQSLWETDLTNPGVCVYGRGGSGLFPYFRAANGGGSGLSHCL